VQFLCLSTYLSAEYGLFKASTLINYYDRKMTETRAVELNQKLLTELQVIFQKKYQELFLSLGKIYMTAFVGFEKHVPKETKIIINKTTEGKRLSDLKEWLYRGNLPKKGRQPSRQVTGTAKFKGIKINATPDEILSEARIALKQGVGKPNNFKNWYVLIDHEKVSSKWLVSILSGLKVSDFQASDARRVLEQLGISIVQNDHL
jgi:hypothetical protein